MQVHLVDGTYELFRSFYAAPSRTTPDGRERGAVRGLVATLVSLLRQPEVTHVGVAFDHVIESFRNDLFDGYKTGEGVDPTLLAQFGPAEDAARALGLVVWPMVEFEADDALATAASRLDRDARVERVVICTPDKDLAQCVHGERVVCLDRRRGRVLDESGVRDRFGVPPACVPDWLALVGDPSDGIPGLPGWGPRAASTVLGAYGHLELVPDDPAAWTVRPRGAGRLARTLVERREDARLYRRLAALRKDAPANERLEALEWRGAVRAAMESLAGDLGGDVGSRVPRWRE